MNAERLKLARRRKGLSLRDLSKELGGLVTAQALGKYERGEMGASSNVLLALAKVLGVSLPFLLAPKAVELGAAEFRSKANTSAKDRARVETAVLEWVERYLDIEEILGLESATWKDPDGFPKRVRTAQDAETAADLLREKWDLGVDPLPNMTELLEERGVKVLLAALPERVSGLTCLVRHGKRELGTAAIVVNESFSLERRRFTMAHELAHRVLSGGTDEVSENLCHRFAGAFLVPKAHLEQEIGEKRHSIGYREILILKRIYGVSASALLMRLEQVGIIDERAKRRAFVTYASRWRSDEPEPMEPPGNSARLEPPERFPRLVYRALAEELITRSKASELLRQPVRVVEEALVGPEADAGHR